MRIKTLLFTMLAACASSPTLADGPASGKADSVTPTNEVVHTKLALDIGQTKGVATITLANNSGITLNTGSLELLSVRDASGPLNARAQDGWLRLPQVASPLTIEYRYQVFHHHESHGVLDTGITMSWPYFCGDWFPCNANPADGTTFELALTNLPAGTKAVYPTEIPAEAPAYQLAFALGAYTTKELGITPLGTELFVSYLPGQALEAAEGSRPLLKAFSWLETTLGAYRFGRRAGSVAANWGAGALGGMEHHPYWHIGTDAIGDKETHVHEAVHGWFGDGVRIACWEDFVLSEGTTSYLTARAMGQAEGANAEAAVWAGYQARLDAARADGDRPSLLEGCNQVDILRDGLFSSLPYMEGAFFYKEVADAIGVAKLDAVLATFYQTHQGKAARMTDMLALIQRETGFDPDALATKWLR